MIKTSPSFSKLLSVSVIGSCFLLIVIFSCNNSGEKIPDVSQIKVSLQTSRFDKDFGSIDTNHIAEGLQKLHTKYPDFTDYYLDTFMPFGIHGNYADTSRNVRENLRPWLTYKDFVNLQKMVEQTYPDTKDEDARLTDAFRYMKYYFPAFSVPKIIYLNVYLSKNPVFALDTSISTFCIGLDWFLGEDFPPYKAIGEPYYIGAYKRRSYMPVAVLKSIFQSKHSFNPHDKTLLDLMIYQGKKQYFLHKVMPHTPDSVIFGLPQRKLDWCATNEGLVYNFFIHQNLLYNKEPANIMPYVNDGPFAVNMPVEDPANNTPGNIGTWLGYKIVTAYMAQNPSITLQQLIDQQTDAAQFLDAAKYRPK